MNSRYLKIIILPFFLFLYSCAEPALFDGYIREDFKVTQITENRTKTIQILNESTEEVQHIVSMAFYADSNRKGHFQISQVRVNNDPAKKKDIYIPPTGTLNIDITYAPLNLETSEASFGGWVTTSEDRGVVREGGAVEMMKKMTYTTDDGIADDGGERGNEVIDENSPEADNSELSDAGITIDSQDEEYNLSDFEPAIHRTLLVVAYDEPKAGYVNVELVGGAVPGPEGEETAVGAGGVGGEECVASGDKACFNGSFSINMPGLMSSGPMEVPIRGSIPIHIEGQSARIDMNEFPPILIALKGNGPGEPLEGKPVDAVSIIISGTPDTEATGTFDGSTLSLDDVAFRVRVSLGALEYSDITPGLVTAVDFNLSDLEVVTEEPYDGSKIIFGVDTTLSSSPSGNSLFDSFLGGAEVIVEFNGTLQLP